MVLFEVPLDRLEDPCEELPYGLASPTFKRLVCSETGFADCDRETSVGNEEEER